MFSLTVDNFGVEYTSKNYEFHFIDTLEKKYPGITNYWSGRIFFGVHFYWDYTKRTITISVHNSINKALSIFQHKKPKHDKHSPHPHATPNYGAKIQHTPPSNTSNLTESQIISCH